METCAAWRGRRWRPRSPESARESPTRFSDPRFSSTAWFRLRRDLFTPRQLVALTTFSDLVGEATQQIRQDALAAGLDDDDRPLRDGGTGARAYAEAVALYLAFAVSQGRQHTGPRLWLLGTQ